MRTVDTVKPHSLHPLATIFPAGLWINAIGCDVLRALTHQSGWGHLATMALTASLALALVTLFSTVSEALAARGAQAVYWFSCLMPSLIAVGLLIFSLRLHLGHPHRLLDEMALGAAGVMLLTIAGWIDSGRRASG